MTDEIRNVLVKLIAKVPGLYSIILTDRDGVPVLSVNTEEVPEHIMKPCFISTFGLAVDQGSKLGLGKTKTLICLYSQYQIVQMNKLPLIITFVASDNCNTGHILSLESELEPISMKLGPIVADM